MPALLAAKKKPLSRQPCTVYRMPTQSMKKVNRLGTMKMPELSPAKRSSSRSRKIEFSADQIEAVRQLVGHTIAEIECELIIETLANQRGSRTNTAKLLGISIRTLRNKIHEYEGRGKLVQPGVH